MFIGLTPWPRGEQRRLPFSPSLFLTQDLILSWRISSPIWLRGHISALILMKKDFAYRWLLVAQVCKKPPGWQFNAAFMSNGEDGRNTSNDGTELSLQIQHQAGNKYQKTLFTSFLSDLWNPSAVTEPDVLNSYIIHPLYCTLKWTLFLWKMGFHMSRKMIKCTL